jgi:hypothetical protein
MKKKVELLMLLPEKGDVQLFSNPNDPVNPNKKMTRKQWKKNQQGPVVVLSVVGGYGNKGNG